MDGCKSKGKPQCQQTPRSSQGCYRAQTVEGGRGGFKIENEPSRCGGREWVSTFWASGCLPATSATVNMTDS